MNLEQHLKNNYKSERPAEVDFELTKEKIILAVGRIQKRRILVRSTFWSALLFISTFGLMTSGISFYQQFITSGGRELLAIALTDTSIVLANGTAFFYSLAESLPIGNIAGGLAATAAFLYSMQHLAEILINNLSRKIYGHKQAN